MADDGNEQRIRELAARIREHQHLYYNAQPSISDQEFDALWDELESLDPENPVLAGVGADIADGWPKARHIMPMGSQSKAVDPESFLAWAAKSGHPAFLVQHKLDGASLELQYRDGLFLKAVTRGDGSIGDDISPNARRMRGLPAAIPGGFSGAVRGEVLMSRAVHAAKYSDKANCRNAANGLMKRKDGIGSEDLDIVCYDALGDVYGAGAARNAPFDTESGKIAWLRASGFETVQTLTCATPEEVIEYRGKVMDQRDNLPFDIDGLVVKGDRIDPDDMSRARPEFQIAFKFDPEEAVTTLRAVEWSESGSLYTPIGIMDPVRLAGTTVQRANLCNPGMLRALSLRIGSRVVITKRGEIIPKIESLVSNPADAAPIAIPATCSCGAALVDEDTRLRCPNPACPKKGLHRLEKWLSVLDIRDFGSVILGKLHAAGRVRRIADLYTLTEDELAAFDRMGEVLARKILRNLRARKELSLPEFIAGFDIEGIGVLIADKLAAGGFDTLEKLRAASVADLDSVEGIAEITAAAIAQGLAGLTEDMDALLATQAVRIRPPVPRTAASGGPEASSSDTSPDDPVRGRSFCFTGELAAMKRGEAERLVRERGGTVKSSVTKDLSYLVTNDPGSGSSKNIKASSLGVPIIDEKAFLALLGAR